MVALALMAVAVGVLGGSVLVARAIERGARYYADTVAGAFASPTDPESFEPFDEQLATFRLHDELEELDYSDLVLAEEA